MKTSQDPYRDIPPARRKWLGRWLAIWSVMVVMTLTIGGITRLTESGLSITEWAPVSGVLPPLSQEAWQDAFTAYQQIPEYQLLNQGMTLDQFKTIYFWEWFHRIWGRLIGLALVLPLVILWLKGWFIPKLTRQVALLGVLTGAQGVLGWYMVASGLVGRTDVSQYRLAAHLGLALVLFVVALWVSLGLLRTTSPVPDRTASGARRLAQLAVLVFITALAGAFVAGIDGGKAYNSFPLMGGRLIPSGYFQLDPWWANLFENVAAVQFNHRWLGLATFAAVMWTWWRGRTSWLANLSGFHLLPIVAMGQVLLGITTLLLVVPIWVASLHQIGAVVLLAVAVVACHDALRPDPA